MPLLIQSTRHLYLMVSLSLDLMLLMTNPNSNPTIPRTTTHHRSKTTTGLMKKLTNFQSLVQEA
uniref:Uncharacterized protein n=1 Tax=Brassica oleracea TaxID=3712 RepID=A0A3P6BRH4_BRAOL|nr:unnamed protein product [Brassica oleracea]